MRKRKKGLSGEEEKLEEKSMGLRKVLKKRSKIFERKNVLKKRKEWYEE